MAWYVGHKEGKRIVFKSAKRPTKEAHGFEWSAVTGPFKAKWMAMMVAYGFPLT